MQTISTYCFFLAIFLFACSNGDQNEGQAASQDNNQVPQGEIIYIAPQDWVQHPPTSRMRKDQYVLPGAEGKEDAELVVYHFPEMGGLVEANLNRWYGQFQQPDGSETASKAQAKKETVNNIPVTTVFVTGTYLKPKNPMDLTGPKEEKPNYAMLAAIAETANGPWFFKATGPEETIAHWRPSFENFVASMHIQ
jgi:hypothetical protein